MFRRLLVIVVTMLGAGCMAVAALAAPPDDVRAAADRFLTALAAKDANAACGMLTARTLEHVGGLPKCAEIFTGVDEDSVEDETESSAEAARGLRTMQDRFEEYVLTAVFYDARALGLARGGYVTKDVPLTKLVSELRTLQPQLRFSTGTRPTAARAKSRFHVVVDRRTRDRMLVLYAESDSGTILRLTAHGFRTAKVAKAGHGVPAKLPKSPSSPPKPAEPKEPEEPITFTIGSVTLLDEASAYAAVDVRYEGETYSYLLSLKVEGGTWKVDDLFVGLFSAFGAAQAKPAA